MTNIIALILAAGESKRLGQPKQLLKHQGVCLLEQVIKQLNSLDLEVHVVLGAHAESIQQSIAIENPHINSDWKNGMGHSLAFGIKQLPPCDGVLVALSDQALIPTAHYQKLLSQGQLTPEVIIATHHKSMSVPALFPKQHFKALRTLQGNQGAKPLIQSQPHITIQCAEASVDIDTADDINRFLGNKNL